MVDGFGVVMFNDGHFGLISDTGEVLLDGMDDVDGFCWGYAYYARTFRLRLLDRVLQKLGCETGICGRIDRTGARFETIGTAMYTPDEQGYFQVKLWGSPNFSGDSDRFGYQNAQGEYVIPPLYSSASPFVDGVAVVTRDGYHFLIDPQGARMNNLRWKRPADARRDDALEFQLTPVEQDGGYRIYDRNAERVRDQLYRDATRIVGGGKYLLCLGFDGTAQIIARDGSVAWSDAAEKVTLPDDERSIRFLQDEQWYALNVDILQFTKSAPITENPYGLS